jgi:hypothetical protein
MNMVFKISFKVFAVSIFLFSTLLNKEISAQSGGLNLMLGLPQGEFKENVNKAGFGISGHFTFFKTMPQMPFSVGINAGYMIYGSERRTIPFNQWAGDVPVDVTRSNNLVNFHILFLVLPFEGPVKPYIDVLFGGNYLFTTTEIKSDDKQIASTTNQDDFAWSYGGGGGFLIKLADLNPNGDGMSLTTLWLDLKVRYLFGTEAEYLKEGSVVVHNDGTVDYFYSKSKVDLFTIHLGVVAELF